MDYFVKYNGKDYPVTVTEDDGKLTVSLDGTDHILDLTRIGTSSSFSVLLDKQAHNLSVVESNDKLMVTVDGQPVELTVLNELQKRLSMMVPETKKKSGETVKSEMPGIVKEVFVKEGQELEAGDSLLVLEAMKMENKIKAKYAGTVKSVYVNAGDQVAINATMVLIV